MNSENRQSLEIILFASLVGIVGGRMPPCLSG
jgi:hypothetical protein